MKFSVHSELILNNRIFRWKGEPFVIAKIYEDNVHVYMLKSVHEIWT